MKEQIAVIGDSAFNLGFTLAGISRIYTAEEDPQGDFEEVMNDSTIGIMISNETTMKKLKPHFREKVERSVKPVLVVLSRGDAGQETLRQLIVKSIGVDLWGKDDDKSG